MKAQPAVARRFAAILMFISLAMIWALLRRARRVGLVPAAEAA